MHRALALLALVCFACSDPAPPPVARAPRRPAKAPQVASGALRVTPVKFPFNGATSEPNIAADGQGGFVVSWIEQGTSAFVFSRFRGGDWFQPRLIAHGKLLINRADFPSIAVAPDGTLYAHWLERAGDGTAVRVARSIDSGATWSTPLRPHADLASAFGFASLLPLRDGSLQLVWLDGAKLPNGEEGAGDMALHAATIDATGALRAATELDGRVCDCCQTAMAMTADGPIVAYRDRSPQEVRDISVVRATPTGWTAPKPLHVDGWKIAACPVNGPQLDASGRNVVAAWFTAAGDKPRANVAFSIDAGATFSKPIVVDDGHPLGHVDVTFLADGSAFVTWLEQAGEVVRIEARRVRADGTRGDAVIVGEGTSAIGFPRIAVSNENVAVVWTGGGAEPSIRMASIDTTAKREP